MKKGLLIAGAVLLVAVVLFFSLRDRGPSGAEVDVEEAALRSLSARVRATGEITPDRKVAISAKVVGEITGLPVREGDVVEEGDVLVEIEREQYEAAASQARALRDQASVSVRRLELQLADARRQRARAEELYEQGVIPIHDLEAARLAEERAEVEIESQNRQVEQAGFGLDRAREDLRRTTIRSPMTGTVVQLDAEKGETVVPGTMNLPGSVLMTIGDMSTLVAEVEVSEVDVVGIELGQPAEVRVDALGEEELTGSVVEIATSGRKDPQLGSIRFTVKIALDAPSAALRPGMTAKVDVLTATREEVVTVPIQAVVKREIDDEQSEVVFVPQDGVATRRQVTTGISDDLHVEIVDGLDAATPVVVGPYRELKDLSDGDEIAIREDDRSDREENAEDGGVTVEVG